MGFMATANAINEVVEVLTGSNNLQLYENGILR